MHVKENLKSLGKVSDEGLLLFDHMVYATTLPQFQAAAAEFQEGVSKKSFAYYQKSLVNGEVKVHNWSRYWATRATAANATPQLEGVSGSFSESYHSALGKSRDVPLVHVHTKIIAREAMQLKKIQADVAQSATCNCNCKEGREGEEGSVGGDWRRGETGGGLEGLGKMIFSRTLSLSLYLPPPGLHNPFPQFEIGEGRK